MYYYRLSFFFGFVSAEFQGPSGLIAVDSDHLCGDQLLITEWQQLAAFPSQPIRVWRCHLFFFLWRLKRGGRNSSESHSDSVLDTLQHLIQTDCQPEPLLCSGPAEISLPPLFSLVEGKLWAFYNQVIIKSSPLDWATCIRAELDWIRVLQVSFVEPLSFYISSGTQSDERSTSQFHYSLRFLWLLKYKRCLHSA